MIKQKILLKNNIDRIVLQLHQFIKLHKENYLILNYTHFEPAPSYYLTQ